MTDGAGHRAPVTELEPGRISERVELLIPFDVPTRPRAVAVIDGVHAGRAWCDDRDDPTWTVVVETLDDSLYVGGAIPAEVLGRILRSVTSGELVIPFAGPADPVRRLLFAIPGRTGEGVEFTERVAPADEAAILAAPPPAGLRLVEIDAGLLPRTDWYEQTLRAFGSAEGWTRNGVGRCLLAGREIASQAMAGPRSRTRAAPRGPAR